MAMQLALNVSLDDEATLANFYAGDNAAVLDALTKQSEHILDQAIFLWGSIGSGRSHLLQAICHQVQQQGRTALYVSLQDLTELSPELFDNLEQCQLVAVDDVHALAGNGEWQEALFHFYNRAQLSGTRLVFAADHAPRSLGVSLPDLTSRLCHGLVFHLQNLSDEQKIAAINLRAKNRGLDLSSGVGSFLLNHYQRDMTALFQLLERLDLASIAAQRKITLPFVRKVLNEQGDAFA